MPHRSSLRVMAGSRTRKKALSSGSCSRPDPSLSKDANTSAALACNHHNQWQCERVVTSQRLQPENCWMPWDRPMCACLHGW